MREFSVLNVVMILFKVHYTGTRTMSFEVVVVSLMLTLNKSNTTWNIII